MYSSSGKDDGVYMDSAYNLFYPKGHQNAQYEPSVRKDEVAQAMSTFMLSGQRKHWI
jgi:hypothetical protein